MYSCSHVFTRVPVRACACWCGCVSRWQGEFYGGSLGGEAQAVETSPPPRPLGWGQEHEFLLRLPGSGVALSGTLPVDKTQKCHSSLLENEIQVRRNSLACGISGLSLIHI